MAHLSPISSGKARDFSVWLARALYFAAFSFQIWVAWRFWSLTWDDSAITLGFARTFAATGRIEPTPGSGIVEGYSTTLWMLLMAAAAKVVRSPTALLAVAKISTLMLNLANLVLIRRWLASWTTEIIACLVGGFIGFSLMSYETINGMETPLIMALVLGMLLLYPLRSAASYCLYLVLGSAFLLCRWEIAWLALPFLLAGGIPMRRRIGAAVTWFLVFCVSNLVRWRYFGSFLPNTIIAKHGEPYTEADPYQELLRHTRELTNFLHFSRAFMLILLGCLAFQVISLRRVRSVADRFVNGWRSSWQFRFTLLFTAFALVLMTAIGENLGPAFRSFYPAWAFYLSIFLLPLAWPRVARSLVLPFATAAVIFITVVASSNALRILNERLAAPVITVGNVSRISSAIAELQARSHHPNVVFAGPDMGAVTLYSNGVQVVDTGLLCDPVLARRRYAAIDDYVFAQRHPDIVETHARWTELEHLESYPPFLADYRPVYVRGIRLFATRRLLSDIDPNLLTEQPFDFGGDAQPPLGLREVSPADHELNRDFGTYLVLR